MEVELIAYTLNPESVCAVAASTCVSENIPLEAKTKGLEMAIDSGHTSVAEHAVFTFSIEGISRACSHQLVRHRMASYTQQSQRYVKMDGFEYVMPESIEKHEHKTYIDAETSIVPHTWTWSYGEKFKYLMIQINSLYKGMIEEGIPEEDARYILPNACCTNLVVTMNARELMHFCALRRCERAQWEIRELADKMAELVQTVAPILGAYMVPQCEKLGYCPEKKGCGKYEQKVNE